MTALRLTAWRPTASIDAVLLVMLLCALMIGPATPTAGATPNDSVVRQRIIVSAPRADSPTGVLTAYQRSTTGWDVAIGPLHADLGELGMGVPADDVFRTPVGTFPLTQAFGRQPNPGTHLPYFQTTDEDWWDEDPSSPTYNTHVRTPELSWSDDAENLYDSGPMYDYAVLMEHNPGRVPSDDMRRLLVWLDPAAKPHITIGVNAPPPAA